MAPAPTALTSPPGQIIRLTPDGLIIELQAPFSLISDEFVTAWMPDGTTQKLQVKASPQQVDGGQHFRLTLTPTHGMTRPKRLVLDWPGGPVEVIL